MSSLDSGKVRLDPLDPDSVVKTYPREDTKQYKCWGSGAGNESLVHPLLPDIVPRTVAIWSDDTAEYTRLERLPGGRFDSTTATEDCLRHVGRVLGRIHSCRHRTWGSLDGRFHFTSAAEAVGSRFEAAVRLMARVDPLLARDTRSWGAEHLQSSRWDGEPTLVHGDFGPANLVRRGERIGVVDWEHARWGHPQEDWAKIRFAARFPEPNGFGVQPSRIRALEEGWQESTGRPAPDDPQLGELLDIYFAMCLGTFFGGHRDPRLHWLRRKMRTA